MTLLVLPGWWNFKLESANLKEYIQTSRIHYLKKIMTKQCFHPDLVLSEMKFTYLILYQTWYQAPLLVIYFVIYNLLDPVCIKLVGWTVSFVFPDRI